LTAHDARNAHEAQSHDNVVTRYDRIPCQIFCFRSISLALRSEQDFEFRP
jgi:hypothetical protein